MRWLPGTVPVSAAACRGFSAMLRLLEYDTGRAKSWLMRCSRACRLFRLATTHTPPCIRMEKDDIAEAESGMLWLASRQPRPLRGALAVGRGLCRSRALAAHAS